MQRTADSSRLRRTLRALGWTLASLLVLVLALLATGWWWAGTDSSLATALARAARYLPAGQTLESRDVTGSLPQQVASAWHKVVRLSLPNGWVEDTNAGNAPKQLSLLWKLATGGPKVRRAYDARRRQMQRREAALAA